MTCGGAPQSGSFMPLRLALCSSDDSCVAEISIRGTKGLFRARVLGRLLISAKCVLRDVTLGHADGYATVKLISSYTAMPVYGRKNWKTCRSDEL